MGAYLRHSRRGLKALERARRIKQIGSSLEAKVVLTADAATTRSCSIITPSFGTSYRLAVEVHEGDARGSHTKSRRRKMER